MAICTTYYDHPDERAVLCCRGALWGPPTMAYHQNGEAECCSDLGCIDCDSTLIDERRERAIAMLKASLAEAKVSQLLAALKRERGMNHHALAKGDFELCPTCTESWPCKASREIDALIAKAEEA